MADNRRRTAADARRVVAKDPSRDTDEVRSLLRRNHERGIEVGREQMRQELTAIDTRTAWLEAGAEMMDNFAARVSGIPNSQRTQQAFREASHILNDARRLGEPPEEPAEDAEPAKAKRSAKAKAKGG